MNQELIFKYLRGETLPWENREVLQWIEAGSENRKQFMRYRMLYDASVWHGKSAGEEKEPPATNRVKHISLKKWMSAAAIVAMTVMSTLFIQKFSAPEERIFTQTVEVPSGQRVNLTLSDGTKVCLNSNSRLSFPEKFKGNKREVMLDGEGFFEVSHNAERPFHVVTRNYDIKVLGTTFNVLAYDQSDIFETSLIEGSVRVDGINNSSQSAILKPNEKASAVNNKLMTSKLETEDDFLWRNGIYVFKNESLTNVFKKLEQYYQVEIIVKNNMVAGYKCTGKFRQKEGIEHIIKVLQSANDFRYKRDEEKNTIVVY